jgi:hypothetical protein
MLLKPANAQFSTWEPAVNACINQCPGANYDQRVGVGKTSHQVYSGAIAISWKSTSFGTYSYFSNWNSTESLFDGSYFNPGRVNGFYLLRRYCNPNGKWNNPEVLCSANGGAVGKASYFDTEVESGYKNSVSVDGKSLTGSCSSGYTVSASAPVRKCSYQSGNSYIDRVYLELTSASDCVRSCDLPSGFSSGSAVYNGAETKLVAGQKINISCKSGFGKQASGTTRQVAVGETDVCEAAGETNRTTILPSLSCQIDGSLALESDCSACN